MDAVTQERASDTFVNPVNGQAELLHDRPPLVLRATVDPLGADPRPIVVVVNHLRSFIDIELLTGEGARVRAKRTAQAESVAALLQELQTSAPGTAVIAVGDYNAYEFNDGYTDPMAVIKGTPAPDDEVVVDQSPDLVEPDFVNLTEGLPAHERYTFIFEGNPQALDHVLVNTVAHSFQQRVAVARVNADFPAAFATDATRPERNSDHDAPVAYFKFPPRQTTITVSPVTVTYDANGQTVQLSAQVAAAGNTVGEGTVAFTVKTGGGATVASGSGPVAGGAALAGVTLPASVLPQALTVTAAFSGGPTTVAGEGSGTLTVQYAVCVLHDPARAVKSGGTYPIRVRLCDVSGGNVSASSETVEALHVVKASSLDTNLEVESAGGANPDNYLRYDAALEGFVFNLKTTGLSPGVYHLRFRAGADPTIHAVEFRVK